MNHYEIKLLKYAIKPQPQVQQLKSYSPFHYYSSIIEHHLHTLIKWSPLVTFHRRGQIYYYKYLTTYLELFPHSIAIGDDYVIGVCLTS